MWSVFQLFIPRGEKGAVGQLDGGGVAEIAICAIAGNRDWGTPCFAMVGADSGLVAEWFAAVAIAHQQSVIVQSEQVRRQTPDAD